MRPETQRETRWTHQLEWSALLLTLADRFGCPALSGAVLALLVTRAVASGLIFHRPLFWGLAALPSRRARRAPEHCHDDRRENAEAYVTGDSPADDHECIPRSFTGKRDLRPGNAVYCSDSVTELDLRPVQTPAGNGPEQPSIQGRPSRIHALLLTVIDVLSDLGG